MLWDPPRRRYSNSITLPDRSIGDAVERNLQRRLPVAGSWEAHLSQIEVSFEARNGSTVFTLWEVVHEPLLLWRGEAAPEEPSEVEVNRVIRIALEGAVRSRFMREIDDLAGHFETMARAAVGAGWPGGLPAYQGEYFGHWGIPPRMLDDAGPYLLGPPPEPASEPAKRARALLLRHLTSAQAAEWANTAAFTCTAPSGTRYRVKRERHINVDELSTETSCQEVSVCRWCYVVAECPVEDQLLAQKLLIEGDEATFRQVALRWPVPGAGGQAGGGFLALRREAFRHEARLWGDASRLLAPMVNT